MLDTRITLNGVEYISASELRSVKLDSYADGLICPICGSDKSKVKDSRYSECIRHNYRKRECLNCGARWITYEVIKHIIRGRQNG